MSVLREFSRLSPSAPGSVLWEVYCRGMVSLTTPHGVEWVQMEVLEGTIQDFEEIAHFVSAVKSRHPLEEVIVRERLVSALPVSLNGRAPVFVLPHEEVVEAEVRVLAPSYNEDRIFDEVADEVVDEAAEEPKKLSDSESEVPKFWWGRILQALSGGGSMTTAELHQQIGGRYNSMTRILTDLKRTGAVIWSREGWQITEEGRECLRLGPRKRSFPARAETLLPVPSPSGPSSPAPSSLFRWQEVLLTLAQHGCLSASETAERTGSPRNVVSAQLSLLRDRGDVTHAMRGSGWEITEQGKKRLSESGLSVPVASEVSAPLVAQIEAAQKRAEAPEAPTYPVGIENGTGGVREVRRFDDEGEAEEFLRVFNSAETGFRAVRMERAQEDPKVRAGEEKEENEEADEILKEWWEVWLYSRETRQPIERYRKRHSRAAAERDEQRINRKQSSGVYAVAYHRVRTDKETAGLWKVMECEADRPHIFKQMVVKGLSYREALQEKARFEALTGKRYTLGCDKLRPFRPTADR